MSRSTKQNVSANHSATPSRPYSGTFAQRPSPWNQRLSTRKHDRPATLTSAAKHRTKRRDAAPGPPSGPPAASCARMRRLMTAPRPSSAAPKTNEKKRFTLTSMSARLTRNEITHDTTRPVAPEASSTWVGTGGRPEEGIITGVWRRAARMRR